MFKEVTKKNLVAGVVNQHGTVEEETTLKTRENQKILRVGKQLMSEKGADVKQM